MKINISKCKKKDIAYSATNDMIRPSFFQIFQMVPSKSKSLKPCINCCLCEIRRALYQSASDVASLDKAWQKNISV